MFWDRFLHRQQPPARQPLRAIVAYRSESRRIQRLRADVLCELAVYVATATPEQIKADNDAVFGINPPRKTARN
jgi:hypothetical protein